MVNVAAIDRARILRGWTRRELSRQAHVDEGTLCDLVAGRREPTFGTLRAICLALELTLPDVIDFGLTAGRRVVQNGAVPELLPKKAVMV